MTYGDALDVAVRVHNPTQSRTLDDGWFLAFEVGDLVDPDAFGIESCDSGWAQLTNPLAACTDVTDTVNSIEVEDGRWLMQVDGQPETNAIGPQDERWHYFRITVQELGRFSGQVFLFEEA